MSPSIAVRSKSVLSAVRSDLNQGPSRGGARRDDRGPLHAGLPMGTYSGITTETAAHLKAINMIALCSELIAQTTLIAEAASDRLSGVVGPIEKRWPSCTGMPCVNELFPLHDEVRDAGLRRAMASLLEHARRAFGTQGALLPVSDATVDMLWNAAKQSAPAEGGPGAVLEVFWRELSSRYGMGRGAALMRGEAARRLLRNLHLRRPEGELYSEEWKPKMERGVVSFRLGLRVAACRFGAGGYEVDWEQGRLLTLIEEDIRIVSDERWLDLQVLAIQEQKGFSLPYRYPVTGGRLVFFKERTHLQVETERALMLRAAVEAAIAACPAS